MEKEVENWVDSALHTRAIRDDTVYLDGDGQFVGWFYIYSGMFLSWLSMPHTYMTYGNCSKSRTVIVTQQFIVS